MIDKEVRRIRIDAKAWTKKYLTAASFSWFKEDCRRRGINEYKFNSKPIHIDSQLLAVKGKNIPRIKVKENKVVTGFNKKRFIKIGEELNFSCIGLEDLTIYQDILGGPI